MSTYGRNRDSMNDIERELIQLFSSHPLSRLNQAEEPTIPADALPDVIREFSELYTDVDLFTDSEMDMLRALLASNPGIEVTPQVLLQFIAERTKHSPRESPGKNQQSQQQLPDHSNQSPDDSPQEEDDDGEDATLPNDRGRNPFTRRTNSSRSSSRGSVGTSKVPSRPPSVPPKTPVSATPSSAFDTSRRQRSTPLGANAPSSWAKRPAPASRRKSVDGGSSSRASSDTESSVTSPSSWGRTGRTRTPSSPTSPSTAFTTPNVSFTSPPYPRPHSRAQSQPFNSIGFHYFSPDRDRDGPMSPNDMSPDASFDQSFDYPRGGGADAFIDSISSLPMPRRSASDSGSDSDGEDESSLGLVLDRSAASSTVSLEPLDRVEALLKSNADLTRKLMEADRAYQNKLTMHDNELEEMQARLEELKSELTATKREEKELRTKERVNSAQMAALESEIAKLQKSLENARASYQSLQKQYQEQCAESESYRNTLRRREEERKDLQDAASLQALETQKYMREHDSYEERLSQLESELIHAQQAHAQLDEQKQENLMLKETIDRMRFEMDEMRSLGALGGSGGGSGTGSVRGSVSKSLGAELLGKMGAQWGMEEDDGDEDEGLELDGEDGDGTDEEDVIQTIITRKKRKVTGRANKVETVMFEETKEYASVSTQCCPSEYSLVGATQTDPEPQVVTATFAIQTEEKASSSFAIQTDPELLPIPRITASIETQTDILELEPEPESDTESELSRSPSTIEEDPLASSSSTVLPPTPKGEPSHADLPPSYTQVASQDSSEPFDTLRKWHHGLQLPIGAIPSGISQDTAEEWRTIKTELGVECAVIDQIVEASIKTGPRPSSHKDRFYNIYNTYVYGRDKDGSGSGGGGGGSFALNALKQALFCMGASACVCLVMGPYIAAQYAPVGGATYYDRAAWSSFNAIQAPGEGFAYDGTSAFWDVMGRVGFGAARIAGGWPT